MIRYFLVFLCAMSLTFVNGQNEVSQEENPDTTRVFEWHQVQEKASFSGGNAAFDQFIDKNIRIPDVAYDSAQSGTVLVQFIEEKDGGFSDFMILTKRHLGFGLEEACLEVFGKMPPWNPATINGQKVRMRFAKPVRFNFN